MELTIIYQMYDYQLDPTPILFSRILSLRNSSLQLQRSRNLEEN